MSNLRIPLILKKGDDLARAEEVWAQYPLDLIADDYGHAQAHSVAGNEATDGNTWVLIAKPAINGWEVSDLTENDYMKWDAANAVAARTAEVDARLSQESDLRESLGLQKAAAERALKQLKKAGIDLDDLKAIIFGGHV